MSSLIADGILDTDAQPTADFCLKVNNLFDLLNSKVVNKDNIDDFVEVFY